MGFKKNMAIRFMKSSGLSQKVYIAANSAKRLDEKLNDLAGITEQVAKGTVEQSSAVDSTSSMTGELSKSINGVVRNAEKLTELAGQSQQSLEEIVVTIKHVAGNSENTAKSVEEISASIEQMGKSIKSVAGNAEELAGSAEEISASIQEIVASISRWRVMLKVRQALSSKYLHPSNRWENR